MSSPERADSIVIAERYEIIRQLGQGAFGHTYLARDTATGMSVAVKRLSAQQAPDWKAYELFEREASVLRSLRHHGIPEIYASLRDTWEGTDAAFLVMEYIEGTSLAQMIESGTHLASDDLLHVFVELLGILDYLHERVPPVLHRDIKPSNIIVRPGGSPALVDFGSVRNVFRVADEAGSTVAGTYGYMPYEQYMGQATPASDLYAMGATMLHILTGRPPKDFMNGEGRIEVPQSLPGGDRFAPVLARLLRPSPAERYATAREVRQALLSTVALTRSASVTVGTAPRRTVTLPELPPAPRAIEGVTREHFGRVAHSMWELMEPTSKPGDTFGLADIAVLTFFSLMTAGILPMTFFAMAHSRRRRLRRFFRLGEPALAEVLAMEPEDVGFSVKLTRVRYEFVIDGEVRRDSDLTLPSISVRWRVGEQIQILYIAEENYDSVVLSG